MARHETVLNSTVGDQSALRKSNNVAWTGTVFNIIVAQVSSSVHQC